jgi:alkylated DNA repair dioxygenase AlkB
MAARHPHAPQPDLFASDPRWPEGLRYRADVLSRDEEADLIRRFAALPFKPFEFHSYVGNRRIVSFGWKYDFAGRAVRKSDPMPPFLLPLRATAAAFAGIAAESLQQAMVTEYRPGAGIGWHRDKAVFDDVVAFSLCAACTLRFRRKREGGWERASVTLQPRSAYLLRGPARQIWEHSISPQRALRYSITFRNFTPGQHNARIDEPIAE